MLIFVVNTFDRYTERGPQLRSLGFPQPPAAEIPQCDTGVGRACSRSGSFFCPRKFQNAEADNSSEFFQTLLSSKSTWLAGDRAAYSNPAYILLGYALENVTGKPYAQILKESITQPLKLESTGMEFPGASRGVVPVGQGSFFYPLDLVNYRP